MKWNEIGKVFSFYYGFLFNLKWIHHQNISTKLMNSETELWWCFGHSRNYSSQNTRTDCEKIWSKCEDILTTLYFNFTPTGRGFFFFIFPLFPTCSLQVPNEFQLGSQYKGGQRGGGGTLSFQRIFYFGASNDFNLFLWWANQIGLLQGKKKKKSWTCEAPPTN
jgi:hypothetical protein